MTLNSNAWIGIVVIAALVVAAIAVWKGRPFSAKLPGVKIGTPQEESRKIRVGNKVKAVDLKAGNFVGTTSDQSDADIDVANQARFKRAELGDFIGAGTPTAPESKEQSPRPQGPADPSKP